MEAKTRSDELGALGDDAAAPRRAIARQLFNHERRMAVEQLVALKKRLKALEAKELSAYATVD